MWLSSAALGAGLDVIRVGRWRGSSQLRCAYDLGLVVFPTDHRCVVGYSHVGLACLRRTALIRQINGRGGNYGEALVIDRVDVITH